MNQVCMIGRLTKDPEVRYSQNGNQMCISRFSIAVDRDYKREGEPDADFFNCIAFGKTGEFVEKYFRKGMKAGITGRLQTGSYTNREGRKIYTTDIVVTSMDFCEKKEYYAEPEEEEETDFVDVPEGIQEELPFNTTH